SCALNRTATPAIYTLSLHDALPISCQEYRPAAALPGSRAHSADIFLISVTSYPDQSMLAEVVQGGQRFVLEAERYDLITIIGIRSEEHTSELQSRENLVCRLLLEKK